VECFANLSETTGKQEEQESESMKVLNMQFTFMILRLFPKKKCIAVVTSVTYTRWESVERNPVTNSFASVN